MRAIILNTDYSYLAMTADWFESVCLLVRGVVTPLENYDKVVRSQYQEFQPPAVAIHKEFVHVGRLPQAWAGLAEQTDLISQSSWVGYVQYVSTGGVCPSALERVK